MRKFLFLASITCSILVSVFLFTKISLNGYKTDFYFYLFTLLINTLSFFSFWKIPLKRLKALFSLFIAIVQVVGIYIFLSVDKLQVDKVYKPINNKYNLYSSLTGWYKKSYFKPHSAELCGDGEFWDTKVPYYFPLIEIETSRNHCHVLGDDSTYYRSFKHTPE